MVRIPGVGTCEYRVNDTERLMLAAVHQGIFRVDNDGTIWRIGARTRIGRIRPVEAKRAEELRPDGYSNVRLTIEGREIAIGAHRMVWLHLNGDIEEKLEINHRNGRRSDNHPSNLEPLTPGENLKHAYDQLGRFRPAGESNGRHKLTRELVQQIHDRYSAGESKRSLSRQFGVAPAMIRRILSDTAWRDEFPHVPEMTGAA
jgi:hypothetical protein